MKQFIQIADDRFLNIDVIAEIRIEVFNLTGREDICAEGFVIITKRQERVAVGEMYEDAIRRLLLGNA